MNKLQTYSLASILIAILLLNFGCASHRHQQIISPEASAVTLQPADQTSQQNSQWTDLSIPVKLEMEAPMRLAGSASCKMINGQAISLSVKVLGFEAASMYADSDSVLIIIRINRTAYAESTARFFGASGLNMSDLQSLLLGRAFIPGSGTNTTSDISELSTFACEGENCIWSVMKEAYITSEWQFSGILSPAGMSMTEALVRSGSDNTISCVYTAHEPTETGILAAKSSFTASVQGHTMKANLTWNFDRAQWNTDIDINRPTIPGSYQRITTAALLRYLQENRR